MNTLHTHEQGDKVRYTGHNASTASTSRTGLRATLAGLLRGEGVGVPSYSASACRPVFLVVLATAICALLLSAGPALAANGHGLTSSFGSETSTVKDPEPLSKPTAVAWSAATKEIYVLDSGHDGIARFSAAGSPEGEFTGSEAPPAKAFSAPNAIAVDNDPGSLSYGDVYVSDSGHNVIDKFGPEGKYLNQLTGTCAAPGVCPGSVIPFGELRGVAVDPSGNLWVESESGPMDEFNGASVNEFVHSEAAEFPEGPGFAVDSKGNIYFVYAFYHNVFRSAPGVGLEFFAGLEGCGCVTGIALDQTASPALDGVYVDQGSSVARYAPDPPVEEPPVKPEEVFGSGVLAEGSGIAVSSTHAVYVADTKAGDIDVFSEGPKPVPTAEKAGVVEGLSATLEGALEGGESRYHFAYNAGGTCKGGQATPTVETSVSGNVSVRVAGLVARTQYTFCLVAENVYGVEFGAPVAFTTKVSTPLVEKTSSSVNRVEATLESSVNPELEPSTCAFQYGTSEAYGHQAPCVPEPLGEGPANVPVTATIEGLEPDTTYDYRILATNPTGTRAGPNETFTTEVLVPSQVQTAPAAGVTATSAQLGGQANPGGSATYYIEYGPPQCSLNGVPNFAWWLCASKSTEAGPLRGNSLQAVTPIQVTGLTPGTTYRYWIVAKNANGSERGEEAIFTTPAALAPAVVGSTPALITAPAIAPPHAPVKPPTRKKTAAQEKAEKLSKTLKQCKKLRSKAKRTACEAQARKRYGPKTTSKPKSSKRGH
jgi:hypothetical protein